MKKVDKIKKILKFIFELEKQKPSKPYGRKK